MCYVQLLEEYNLYVLIGLNGLYGKSTILSHIFI